MAGASHLGLPHRMGYTSDSCLLCNITLGFCEEITINSTKATKLYRYFGASIPHLLAERTLCTRHVHSEPAQLPTLMVLRATGQKQERHPS